MAEQWPRLLFYPSYSLHRNCSTVADCGPTLHFTCLASQCWCAWEFEGEDCQVNIGDEDGRYYNVFVVYKFIFLIVAVAMLGLMGWALWRTRKEGLLQFKNGVQVLAMVSDLFCIMFLTSLHPFPLIGGLPGFVCLVWSVYCLQISHCLLAYLWLQVLSATKRRRRFSPSALVLGVWIIVSLVGILAVTIAQVVDWSPSLGLSSFRAVGLSVVLYLNILVSVFTTGVACKLYWRMRAFGHTDKLRAAFNTRIFRLIVCKIFISGGTIVMFSLWSFVKTLPVQVFVYLWTNSLIVAVYASFAYFFGTTTLKVQQAEPESDTKELT